MITHDCNIHYYQYYACGTLGIYSIIIYLEGMMSMTAILFLLAGGLGSLGN